MLLQTNSYVVPNDKREEHARLMRRIRQVLLRLGCDHFEVYEQVGTNWSPLKTGGRFIQMMRFHDRQHHQAVQNAERSDPAAQDLIREFCQLIDLPSQQEQGLFATGNYGSILSMPETESSPGPAAWPAAAAPSADADPDATVAPPPRHVPEQPPAKPASGNSKGHTHVS